jgi:hypothetical protein
MRPDGALRKCPVDIFSDGPACRGAVNTEPVNSEPDGALKNDSVNHFSDEPDCSGVKENIKSANFIL